MTDGGEMDEIREPAEGATTDATEAAEDTCSRKVYDELYDRWLRLQAEYDNHRKRTEREKDELRRTAAERLMADILPVVDNLELAVRHAGENPGAPGLEEGIALILKQFQGVLERNGLEAVAASAGSAFDPRHHEALALVESTEHADGTVVEEHQRGYTLGGRILRPARVTVSRAASTGSGDE